jgi:hypothetical protein
MHEERLQQSRRPVSSRMASLRRIFPSLLPDPAGVLSIPLIDRQKRKPEALAVSENLSGRCVSKPTCCTKLLKNQSLPVEEAPG